MKIKNVLNEDFEYENDSWDDGEVAQGKSFFEDGYDWKWIRRVGDVVHLDFDNWAVWIAFRPEDENNPEGQNVVAFFIVDEDTGFIDWGPCDTVEEAKEFLDSKVQDWELDESIEEDLESDLDKIYKFENAHEHPSILDNIKTLERSELVDHITPVNMYDTEVFEMVATDGRVFYLVPSTLSQFDVYDENEELVTSGEFTRSIPNEVLMDKSNLEFLYELVGGEYAGTYTESEVKALPCFSGRYTEDQSDIRAKGGFTSRVELDNKPKLDGYLGPMMGGYRDNKMVLRYETQDVYNRLSEDINNEDLESTLRQSAESKLFDMGYDKDFISEYFGIKVEDIEDHIKVTIWGELSYEEFSDLADTLNPIIEKEDPYAYLDNETTGRMVAYIRKDQSEDIPDEQQVNEWVEEFNACSHWEDLKDVYEKFSKVRDTLNSGTIEAIYKVVDKKVDELKPIEESLVKNPDQEGPYSKKQIEQDLYWLTDKFTRDDVLKCGYKEEAEYAEEILSKHYASVEVDKVGSWFQVEFKDALKKDVKESFSSNINLDKVVMDVANQLDDSRLGDKWIEVFPTADAYPISNGEYGIKLEITGADERARKANFHTSNGRVKVSFWNGSEGVFDSTEEIARFIAGEYGLTLNESKCLKESSYRGDELTDLFDWLQTYDGGKLYDPFVIEFEDVEDKDLDPEDIINWLASYDEDAYDDLMSSELYESKSINEGTSKTSFAKLKAKVEEIAELLGLNIYVTKPEKKGDSVELFCDEVFDIEGTGLIDEIEYGESGYDLDIGAILEYLANVGLYEPDEEAERYLYESKSMDESFNDYIYLFPELTDDDIKMMAGYNIKYLGMNHGPDGSEDNWVVYGAKEDIEKYAEKYLGYELHPDYLYEYDGFAGEIVNESLNEEAKNYVILEAELFYDIVSNCDEEELEIFNRLGWVNGNEIIIPKGTKLTYHSSSNPGGAGYDYYYINDTDDLIGFSNIDSDNDYVFANVEKVVLEESIGTELDKDDILEWLAEHEQAYEDAQLFFMDVPLKDVPQDELISWIEDHNQLYQDFIYYFYEEKGWKEDEISESKV